MDGKIRKIDLLGSVEVRCTDVMLLCAFLHELESKKIKIPRTIDAVWERITALLEVE